MRHSQPMKGGNVPYRDIKTMDNDKLASLAEQAKNGDKKAFGELYAQTGRSVYFNCLKLTGDEHLAQDILQDTFVTAYEKISQLDKPESFPAWINRIAVNKCKMYFRKTSAEPLEDIGGSVDELTEDNSFDDSHIFDESKRRAVMEIIDKELTPAQRQMVILFYFNGMSVAQISEIMDCPVGSVTSRLSHARQKIREAVLAYEKKNDERLHVIIPLMWLSRLFTEEAKDLDLPKSSLWAESPADSSAAPPDNTPKNLKSGGRKMLNSLKAKIIAGTAAVAVAGGGVTAAVMLSNDESSADNTNSGDHPSVSADADSYRESENSAVTENTDVSDNPESEAPPVQDREPLWIETQDFSTGQLTETPADFTIFADKISVPVTVEELDSKYDAHDNVHTDPENKFSEIQSVTGTVSEILSYGETIPADTTGYTDSFTGKIHLYEKGTEDFAEASLYIFNYSDEELTFQECFDRGWWALESSDDASSQLEYKFFGYTKEDVGDTNGANGKSDAQKKAMEMLMEKLGKPHYYAGSLPSEENSDDDPMMIYTLAWEFDEYTLEIMFFDFIVYGENTFQITSVAYMPNELWEQTAQENRITELN